MVASFKTDFEYKGKMTLREPLAGSLNIPALKDAACSRYGQCLCPSCKDSTLTLVIAIRKVGQCYRWEVPNPAFSGLRGDYGCDTMPLMQYVVL